MAEFSVASESDLKAGEMLAVEAGGKALVIFKDQSGKICALEDRCSHADVKLSEGQFDGSTVQCMAHGAKFDVCSGRHLCMPAVAPVHSYQTKVIDGKIVIQIP